MPTSAVMSKRMQVIRLPNVRLLSCGRIRKATSRPVATSEPVVHHHGREGGRRRKPRGAAVCFNSLLGGACSSRPLGQRKHRTVTRRFQAESPNRPANEAQTPATSRVFARCAGRLSKSMCKKARKPTNERAEKLNPIPGWVKSACLGPRERLQRQLLKSRWTRSTVKRPRAAREHELRRVVWSLSGSALCTPSGPVQFQDTEMAIQLDSTVKLRRSVFRDASAIAGGADPNPAPYAGIAEVPVRIVLFSHLGFRDVRAYQSRHPGLVQRLVGQHSRLAVHVYRTVRQTEAVLRRLRMPNELPVDHVTNSSFRKRGSGGAAAGVRPGIDEDG